MLHAIVSSCEKCGGWCCKCIAVSLKIYTARRYETYPFWSYIHTADAKCINPWLPRPFNRSSHIFYTCEFLNNGLCSNYELRPDTCKNYPEVDNDVLDFLDNPNLFYVPWCHYRGIALELLNEKFITFEDGESCRLFYLEALRMSPELSSQFLNPGLLLSQASKNLEDGIVEEPQMLL